MKQLLLAAVFVMSVLSLNAQTGLFNLSFGDSREECTDILETQGFSIDEATDSEIVLINSDNELVDHIILRFAGEEGILNSWSIAYNAVEDEDIESLATEALESYHSEGWDYDEEWEYYSIVIDDDHYVEAGWGWWDEFFWVDYSTGSYGEGY
jgi:hypothetical protein